MIFSNNATAGNGFFNNLGGRAPSGLGGLVLFSDNGQDMPGNQPDLRRGGSASTQTPTGGSATIINNGGNGGSSATGAVTEISCASTAGQAHLVAYSGRNGGGPGYIYLTCDGDGGQAQMELHGGGYLDISSHDAPGVTIGSLTADGQVYLGSLNLTLGSSNLDSSFGGIIQESGGSVDGKNGSLTKIGTATQILSGSSTYAGGTTVTSGNLILNNAAGSATGKGPVQVSGGTLGGVGRVTGQVTVGDGAQSGGILAPGATVKQPATFTVVNTVTFQTDGTYSWRINTKTAQADQLVAKGLTIANGAQFNLVAVANSKLASGTIFTAISNTATTPISGTFANLADGGTITSGANSFKANYEGGDGNDLTLTVQ